MRKPGKAEKQAARSERLSAALRENLKRRKAQAREREHARDPGSTEEVPAKNAESGASAPEFRRNRGSD
jgi:hypothetical protein